VHRPQPRQLFRRWRLEEGTPIRRASLETYQTFSGCTSVAARIPSRVFGNRASRALIFRIMRKCLRYLRNCQDIPGPLIHATEFKRWAMATLNPTMGLALRAHLVRRIVVCHSSPPRSSRVYCENWIECLVQLHRSIATGIAHDPRAVHDVVERLVRVPVNPQ